MDRQLLRSSWVKDTLKKMPAADKSKGQQLLQRSRWEMLSLEEVLTSLERMPNPPSVENLTCILRKCTREKNLAYALRLHAYLHKSGLETHKALGNYLVPMLVEVGSMCDAKHVFDRLVDRNEYSWTSLITGCIECGDLQHAFILYQKMLENSIHPSGFTFLALLNACARLKDTKRGQEIHADIASKGLLERYLPLGNALVDMYAKCDSLPKARELFDKLPVRDIVSWNTLIAGYAEHGLGQEALNCFDQVQLEGIFPDAITFVCSLKACGSIVAIDKGQEIHSQIVRKGLLEGNRFVGSTLVDMYAKCGLLAKAQEVFDKLQVRDEVSWNALIAGYADFGLSQEALNSFEQMQLEGMCPDAITFLCCLKACGSIGAIDKGLEIHAQIGRNGERDRLVGNTLVDMYAKCGLLAKAREVFDKLPVRDAVSWTALIAGYAENDLGQEALNCFEQMQFEGISPDALTFVCSLKACGNLVAIEKGMEMHSVISTTGLFERNPFIGSTLVDMYTKCGLLAKAREVFDNLPVQDAVTWNVLIAGYAEHGLGQEALNCFEQIQLEGISPDAITLVYSLKACGTIGAIHKGREIHAHIARKGLFERDPLVGSTLVDMYVKCGLLAKAQEVFDKLPARDAVSWNALIAGYAEHGLGQEALNCFEQMQLEDISPDAITFLCSLKACGSIGAIDEGREIHAQIERKGLFEINPFIGNTLVDMYAKCDSLAKAQEVFDKLRFRDAVSWTSLIAGYAEHGLGQVALNYFEQMQLEGVSPNVVTFVCSLKACGNIGAIGKGIEIHADIATKGLMEKNPFVGSTLVDMYAKCGLLAKAREVFDKLPLQDVVTWNLLIAGYAEHGLGHDALNCLEQMQLEGISPDVITFVCSLKACGTIGAIEEGTEIHTEIATKGLLGRDPYLGNALVDMYGKCGLLAKRQEVFDELAVRDAVSWNALIAGYAEHELGQEGLNCFEQMQLEGISPDAITFVCSLKACGSVGAIDKGREIHAQIVKKGLFERNPFLGSTLVDMYAKYGLFAQAHDVFDKLPVRDAVSWNALISGYANLGESENVFLMLDRMRAEDIKPDAVTFLSILTACSHTGLVDNGQTYFEAMSKDYGITPAIEHYTCMIDLLGRAGQLDKAVLMIKMMPFNSDLALWHTVLGASRKWRNVDFGRWAFEHAVQLEEKDAAAYVLMFNIYTDAHMQEDANQVEVMRRRQQSWKKRRHGWNDVSRIVHSFWVEDTRHSQSNYIFAKLEDLSSNTREEGFGQDLHWLSPDTSDDVKETRLCGHSENLAIACALINTANEEPINDVINLQVCKDCHLASVLTSKAECTILVRDTNHFHALKDGKCACWDHW